tara:strand:+ start:217 stop:1971 length:1755 start_codon:yes stop_codon:yes gene_type:complete
MTPADLLLITAIVLVLLLLYYYYSRKKGEPIPDKIPTLPVKPVKSVKLPKRSLEIVVDTATGVSAESESKTIQLSTVNELEKVIDDIVAVNMADRKAINEEATRLEQRIIDDQRVKVQELKTNAEKVITEKKEELSAFQKRLAELKERQRVKKLQREMELQKQRSGAYATDREKNRKENEQKLMELKLKRQQAAEAQRKATIQSEVDRMNLEFDNERLLSEARDKLTQDKIKAEEEAAEVEASVRQLSIQAVMDEEQARIDLENAIAYEERLKADYENAQREEQEKIDAAMQEFDDMVEKEKARQTTIEGDDEAYRAKEKQKLLDANAAAIAELEEAEAEQARMDAEEQALREKVDADMKAQESTQQALLDRAQQEYDSEVAADEEALKRRQKQSEDTGDEEQEAERQAARDLEQSSLQDSEWQTSAERQRELEALAAWEEEWNNAERDARIEAMLSEEERKKRSRPTDWWMTDPKRLAIMEKQNDDCYDRLTDEILPKDECDRRKADYKEKQRRKNLGPGGRFAEDCANGTIPASQCDNTVDEETMDMFESGDILNDFMFFSSGGTDESHLGTGSPGANWRVT